MSQGPEDTSSWNRPLSLSELNAAIRASIELGFPDTLWVIAEISEMRITARGHCFLELVEKDEEALTAQMRANIWSSSFRNLTQRFEKATGETLRQGMKLLFACRVTFHEVYGMSLSISDIDPGYTLGEMARKKREITERLRKEGLIDRNRAVMLPLVPQRIAVISSATAAGYGDFLRHLEDNPYGYRFSIDLFPAVMQGQGAETSIIVSLEKVRSRKISYDAAVIIRGGGSQADLSCFDAYGLAAAIAVFPLPVITGIGHERDDTVADIVAHTRMKTPTAAAEFLISVVRDFEQRVMSARQTLVTKVGDLLREENYQVVSMGKQLLHLVSGIFHNEERRLQEGIHGLSQAASSSLHADGSRVVRSVDRIVQGTRAFLLAQGVRVARLEQAVRLLDPVNILKRGYSISYCGERIIRDSSEVREGDRILTKLFRGEITSIVEEKNGKE